MKEKRTEIGCIEGKAYHLMYDQVKNQTAAYSNSPNTWRWWLTMKSRGWSDYIGDFATKAEAYKAIREY